MARNKYPEETIKKIMDVSLRLFMEKGYDQTSVQDIVNSLGMSKGAIYHHFKSKEEILNSICDSYYQDKQWFYDVLENPSMNGLQKLKKLFAYQLGDEQKLVLDTISIPMFQNPRLFISEMQATLAEAVPMVQQILQEGIEDGSITVSQPREAAEVVLILVNVWINPGLFITDKERFMQKVQFYAQILDSIGVPVLDDEMMKITGHYYDVVTSQLKKDTGKTEMPGLKK